MTIATARKTPERAGTHLSKGAHVPVFRASAERLAAPSTAYIYDWNMLPIGQQLWLEHLLTYETYPPLQAPESYNLSQVLDQLKKAPHGSD
jgi:hypothetical protein